MRVHVLLTPGPASDPGKPAWKQDPALMAPHLELMLRYGREGRILFGGPFASGQGGVLLFEATDASAVAEMLDADPAIAGGILTYRIEPMRPVVDTLPAPKASGDR